MLCSVADRQAALRARFPNWEARTLDQALDAAAAEFGDRPFVITDDRTWTYRDMREWSERIAGGLHSLGLRAGEHVAMVLANYPELVAVKFAVARLGAVAVPVNILNRRDELAFVLQQSDAALLVTMDRFRDLDYLSMLDELAPDWREEGGGERFPRLRNVVVFPTGGAQLPDGATPFSALEVENMAPLEVEKDPGSLADIIYTSGTTGSPKGVLITHDMLTRTAFGSAYARAFEDGRRIVFALPIYHVFGYVEGLLSVLYVGGAIVPRVRFDARDMLQAIERHSATDALMIPTMTLGLIEAAASGHSDLSTLQSVLSSGARAPERVWRQITDVLGVEEITTGYGMTEVTASSTVTRPDDPFERLLATNGRLRDVGVAGDPALGNRLVIYRVIDSETGRELPPGSVGELMAKGPGVTRGYYKNPDATGVAFDAEGWLHTGDLGHIDEEDYLVLVGRRKESYRCGGELVLPTEVEDLLTSHPLVEQAHVIPLPDDRMGEVGVAFVVTTTGAEVTPDELLAMVGERLARFKVPRHLFIVEAGFIPTTASGRARKFLLAEKARQVVRQ